MNTVAKFSTGPAALLAVAPIALAATARADDEPVYFSFGDANCAILTYGTIGCDRPVLTTYNTGYGGTLPWLQSPQIIADPKTRSGFDFTGEPYTLPGGNPSWEQVVKDHGWTSGWPTLEYAGVWCGQFRDMLRCGVRGPGEALPDDQAFTL
ncbi:hypothetical protein NDR87_17165 [Nocardia sp. CDC159]|uniref:Secreted protein n=1 Tax=Nocardia pulmonis TaxID=2951408 RepID=A0A9X2E7Y6_9NOCA|nr:MULTISPECIES: hypothetical protein [Nocardia]MCM6775934.1 hypothetical protein [Nocardia pulmonis]MCM6788090.1 hypothetical protein [Nocardia sp. CDC159]